MFMPSLNSIYASSPVPLISDLEALSNEVLYEALVGQTAPLDPGLELLVHRLKPIIINASRGYLSVLSWDYSDAL